VASSAALLKIFIPTTKSNIKTEFYASNRKKWRFWQIKRSGGILKILHPAIENNMLAGFEVLKKRKQEKIG
jgi:hypothetical protein